MPCSAIVLALLLELPCKRWLKSYGVLCVTDHWQANVFEKIISKV